MNNLHTYIAATKGELNGVKLVASESFDKSYTDQGIVVNCIESIFHFSNGVVMKCCNEADVFEDNEQICPECWISYEVISKSDETHVFPKTKTFLNHCQEAFWLKMNTQQ